MIYLINTIDNSVVGAWATLPQTIAVPGVGDIIPVDGWTGGGYVLRNDAPLPPAAAPPDLAAIKLDAKRRIIARADEIAEVITGAVPLSERLSWSTKEAAARAVVAGTATTVQQSLLGGEAQIVGETVADLAASIIAKADTYIVAAGLIAGQRRKSFAAVDALTDVATAAADVADILTTAEAEAQTLLASLSS